MKRLPIYGDKTIKLAFEFGVILAEVAHEMKMELTPEISERAENIFISEIRTNGFEKTALSFAPLALAALEV